MRFPNTSSVSESSVAGDALLLTTAMLNVTVPLGSSTEVGSAVLVTVMSGG